MMEKETQLISDKLLKLLVCPISGGRLEIKTTIDHKKVLFCRRASLAYSIKDGTPILIPEQAEKIDIDQQIF